MARRSAANQERSAAAKDEGGWSTTSIALAVLVWIAAYFLSGQVFPKIFGSQCTTTMGLCTTHACGCKEPLIKRELVTEDGSICHQCVREFCPAVPEGNGTCTNSPCECEDPSWPRVNLGADDFPCWQCVQPPTFLTLRAADGRGCLGRGGDQSGRALVAESNAYACVVFRYAGAFLSDSHNNGSCLTWAGAENTWAMTSCSSSPGVSLRFSKRPLDEPPLTEQFCAGRANEELCAKPADYMCTTDITQCSMGECRCEQAGWVKQELHTVNGTICHTCTPPASACPVAANQCTTKPCYCSVPGHEKVQLVTAAGKETCYSCRPKAPPTSWLYSGCVFVLCVFVGLGVGTALRRVFSPEPQPVVAQGGKANKRQRRGNVACHRRSWSERLAENLEDAVEAVYLWLSEGPLATARFRKVWRELRRGLDSVNAALEPVYRGMETAQDRFMNSFDFLRLELMDFMRHSEADTVKQEELQAVEEEAVRPALAPLRAHEPPSHISQVLMHASDQASDPLLGGTVKDLAYDPLNFTGKQAAAIGSSLSLPKEVMRLVCGGGAPGQGRTPKPEPTTPAAPGQQRALRKLQQRRDQKAAAAAAASKEAAQEETAPIDESWIDELEADKPSGAKAQDKAGNSKAQKKKKKRGKAGGAGGAKAQADAGGDVEEDDGEEQARENEHEEPEQVEEEAAEEEEETQQPPQEVAEEAAPAEETAGPVEPAKGRRKRGRNARSQARSGGQSGDDAAGRAPDAEAEDEVDATGVEESDEQQQGVENLLERLRTGAMEPDGEGGVNNILLGEAMHGIAMVTMDGAGADGAAGGARQEPAVAPVHARPSSVGGADAGAGDARPTAPAARAEAATKTPAEPQKKGRSKKAVEQAPSAKAALEPKASEKRTAQGPKSGPKGQASKPAATPTGSTPSGGRRLAPWAQEGKQAPGPAVEPSPAPAAEDAPESEEQAAEEPEPASARRTAPWAAAAASRGAGAAEGRQQTSPSGKRIFPWSAEAATAKTQEDVKDSEEEADEMEEEGVAENEAEPEASEEADAEAEDAREALATDEAEADTEAKTEAALGRQFPKGMAWSRPLDDDELEQGPMTFAKQVKQWAKQTGFTPKVADPWKALPRKDASGTPSADAGAGSGSSKPLAANAPDFVPFSMMMPQEEQSPAKGRKGKKQLNQRSSPQDLVAAAALRPEDPSSQSVPITTMMVSGIPLHHSAETFRHQLDAWGLLGTYNFFFMPMDRETGCSAGYAVINFIDPTFATLCQWLFAQYQFEGAASPSPVQGLESNVSHWGCFAEQDASNTPLIIPTPTPSQWAVNGVNTMLNSKFSPQIREQFHKTKLCVFNRKNKCQMGSGCPFAHNQDELMPAPDLAKTKLCYNFFRRRCNDSKCKFAHGYQELRATSSVYKTELCRWWSNGNCKAGSACRYAHGVEELRGAMPMPQGGAGMPFMPPPDALEGQTGEVFPLWPHTWFGADTGPAGVFHEAGGELAESRTQERREDHLLHVAIDCEDSFGDGQSEMGLSDISTLLAADVSLRRQQTAPAPSTAPKDPTFVNVDDQANSDVMLRVKGTFMEAVQLNTDSCAVPLRRSWSEGDLAQLSEIMDGIQGLDEL